MTDNNATPLMALDAVAFDTETTGLDPSRAHLVEIGAVRIRSGQLVLEEAFRTFINPGEPIPVAAIAVHGITDQAVAGAPSFQLAWNKFLDWRSDALLIGHSLGFDFAIIRQACNMAGLAWSQPRALDTRLLAEVCAPRLAGYDLNTLSAWLGITPEDRHSAVGDAITAARLFAALVPRLREAGVRTLAEAERACSRLTHVLDDHRRAGWVSAIEVPVSTRLDVTPRSDLYPYRNRTGDLMSTPVYAAPQTSVRDAIARMNAHRISSLLVAEESSPGGLLPSQIGIVTERDIMRALGAYGESALGLSVTQVQSCPLQSISAEALSYRAIGHMTRLKLRHLGVTDKSGHVCGIVSARDLLRLRGLEAIWLSDEVDHATSVPALARVWAKLPEAAGRLRREGLTGAEVALVVSQELRALTARAAFSAEDRLRNAGHGGPPCAYAVAVLGSAGRGESLLALDQDNAIVFASGNPDGEADRWFAMLGREIADLLHAVGVPYCPGGVMASNANWRGSVETWRKRIGRWIRTSNPQDLLSVDIFFDLLPVHGDVTLADDVWRYAFEAAANNPAFAKLLAESAGRVEPGLDFFGRLRTQEGRIDIKKTGLLGVVSAARVLAIRHGFARYGTRARLQEVRALGLGHDADLEAFEAAQSLFLDLLADQQVDDIEQGIPPSNKVSIKSLSAATRERLRTALQALRHLDPVIRELLFSN